MTELESPSPPPTPKPRATICPYCGSRSRSLSRCDLCKGLFDPLSRQATQNAMGPWFIRDEARPHRPGCSYETLVRMVERARITPETVIRGPATLQFWTLARWCPGVAHLLGICHSCQRGVDPLEPACRACGASFRVAQDRQHLGLGAVRFVPGRSEQLPDGPAARAVPAAPSLSVPRGAEAKAAPGPEALVDLSRQHRLERELRRARRWQAVLGVGLGLVALALGAVLTIPALDLDAGPLGRWLGARRQGSPPSNETGLTGEIPEIVTPAPGRTPASDEGAGEAPGVSELSEEAPDPQVSPGPDPGPGAGVGLPSSQPDGRTPADATAEVKAFDQLRRLR